MLWVINMYNLKPFDSNPSRREFLFGSVDIGHRPGRFGRTHGVAQVFLD